MGDELSYRTVKQISHSEFRDRGSKFYGFVYPVKSIEEIKIILKKIKEEHPKAVHCCYAYRLGFDKQNYRSTDDGEPSGSAGKPILGQIDSAEVTNVLVAVIRYFGGVLLGVPGLIQAYKTSASDALANNQIVVLDKTQSYQLQFDYTLMNDVMRLLKIHHAEIVQQQLLLFCEMDILVSLKNKNKFEEEARSLYGLKITSL